MNKPYDPDWLDAQYNARLLVREHPAFFRRWADESEATVQSQPCRLDVAYGEGPSETLDIFPCEEAGAPVLFFIHGGYWRALDKRDHSFIAPGFTQEGASVVIPNYALCPSVTIPQIVMQMVKALAWTWRNVRDEEGGPRRIVVAGHSAGGHLAAMMLACQWQHYAADLPPDLVKASLSISGLHDLEPIMHSPYLQTSLNLTREQVRAASPARLPAPARGTLYSVNGGNESEEFHRQNQLIRKAWGAQRVPVCESLAGLNHFSVLDSLVEPAHRLNGLALQLLRV